MSPARSASAKGNSRARVAAVPISLPIDEAASIFATVPSAFGLVDVGGAPPSKGGQLSEMDVMLADLAFAARPHPVATPEEAEEAGSEVAPPLGSFSPSNFSPDSMVRGLLSGAPSPSFGRSTASAQGS